MGIGVHICLGNISKNNFLDVTDPADIRSVIALAVTSRSQLVVKVWFELGLQKLTSN